MKNSVTKPYSAKQTFRQIVMFEGNVKRAWNIPSCTQGQLSAGWRLHEFISLPSPKLKFVVEADVIVRNAWRLTETVFLRDIYCT
jgi:hypothetical protein